MSEMNWEDVPEVTVPKVRDWIGPAFEAWTRGCYPPRRGFTVVIGIFIIPWAIWQFVKLGIYAAGIVLMLLANIVWIIAELITYRRRVKREALRRWTPYMREALGE